MTRIEFYFNVADKQQLVESLVTVALNKRRLVNILVPDDNAATSLGDYLWQHTPSSFLPNVQLNSNQTAKATIDEILVDKTLVEKTPVVIAVQGKIEANNPFLQDDMLINLSINEPVMFSRYTQLVEMVGVDEIDKVAGRKRYKFYRDRGYEIKNIDYLQLQ
jgi:DNA polymerase III subunit chi